MRILVSTDHMSGGGNEFNFATYMAMYDYSFATRYLRNGIAWRGHQSKSLEPERHDEADKYDIYYMDVQDKDVDSVIAMCQQLQYVRVVAPVNAQYNFCGEALYVSESVRGNRAYSTSGEFRLPHNLMIRPDTFQPRMAEARQAPVTGHEFKPR